jgi:hypothetical protein
MLQLCVAAVAAVAALLQLLRGFAASRCQAFPRTSHTERKKKNEK